MTDVINPLWDVKDLAAFLKTTPAAIYPRLTRDKIPHIRIGRIVRFDPAAIRVWLAARTTVVEGTKSDE